MCDAVAPNTCFPKTPDDHSSQGQNFSAANPFPPMMDDLFSVHGQLSLCSITTVEKKTFEIEKALLSVAKEISEVDLSNTDAVNSVLDKLNAIRDNEICNFLQFQQDNVFGEIYRKTSFSNIVDTPSFSFKRSALELLIIKLIKANHFERAKEIAEKALEMDKQLSTCLNRIAYEYTPVLWPRLSNCLLDTNRKDLKDIYLQSLKGLINEQAAKAGLQSLVDRLLSASKAG